jgi:hypothetical protein
MVRVAIPRPTSPARFYLRAYGRELPLDRALVARWRPVCAAVRLAEDIEPERVELLAIARAP